MIINAWMAKEVEKVEKCEAEAEVRIVRCQMRKGHHLKKGFCQKHRAIITWEDSE